MTSQFFANVYLDALEQFVKHQLMTEIKPLLWKSGLPVAWIEETGRQVSGILERTLTCRWSATVSTTD